MQHLDSLNTKIRMFIGNAVVENLSLQASCEEMTARLATALQENEKLKQTPDPTPSAPKQDGE